jgi:hypothetical protein
MKLGLESAALGEVGGAEERNPLPGRHRFEESMTESGPVRLESLPYPQKRAYRAPALKYWHNNELLQRKGENLILSINVLRDWHNGCEAVEPLPRDRQRSANVPEAVKRPGAHAAPVRRNQSRVVDENLSAGLHQYGQGREVSIDSPAGEVSDPPENKRHSGESACVFSCKPVAVA